MEEECVRCGKWFKMEEIWINIPHTDVYYCKTCFFSDQPERLNPEDQFVGSDKVICDSLNSMET